MPLLYPRYLGDLGAPSPLWGGVHNLGDFPSHTGTRAALSAYCRVGREAPTLPFSASTHVPQPLFYDGAILRLPQEKAFLTQPDSPPF